MNGSRREDGGGKAEGEFRRRVGGLDREEGG